MDLSSVNELTDFILSINRPLLFPLDQDGLVETIQQNGTTTKSTLSGQKRLTPLKRSLDELDDLSSVQSVVENVEQKETAPVQQLPTINTDEEQSKTPLKKKRSLICVIDDDSGENVKQKPAQTLKSKKKKSLEERSKEACICPKCNKVFSSGRTLRTHLVTHRKDRPFPCDQCQKTFQTKQNLQNHKNVHLGLKPYKCTHCSKCFAEKSTLTKHHLRHSKKKNHACTFCEKRFTQTRSLQNHINNFHKNEGEIVFPWIGAELVEKEVADFDGYLNEYSVEANNEIFPLDCFN